MKINQIKINIPTNANKLIHLLQDHGYQAYVVGGCVRDSVLGRKPNDWDICTSATPDQMLQVFKDHRVIETGLQHGTITVVVDGEGYEVTTYRIDGVYSDNRRPDSVEFTNNLIEDLKRRDFTINAMAYNDEEGLIDPFGGLEDIKYQKIQCVGSAKDRFNEDALRILRAIRLASQLEFVPMPDTDWEIHQQYKRLLNVSTERINSEFCKIVASDSFCVQLVLYSDVFSLFIPEIHSMIDFSQNNPWHIYNVYDHTMHAVEHCKSKDLIVRLAVFFHDIGKPYSYQDGEDGIRHFKGHGRKSAEMTDAIMKRLRFDNNTRNKVVELVFYHDVTFEPNKKSIKRWLNKIGEEQLRRLLDVQIADKSGQNLKRSQDNIEKIYKIRKILEEVLQEKECFSLKDLVINGNDVKKVMHVKGKDIGFWLNEILNRVIDGELKNNREDLIQWMTGISDGWIKF